MNADGPLLTIAEISVALAGFASIVVAIRGVNPSHWSRQDRFGLANVFAASVGALLGGLLPFPLRELGLAEATVWLVSNVFFGVAIMAYLTFLLVRQSGTPARTPRVFWTFVGGGYVMALALVLAGFGIFLPPGPALLLIALVWALLAAFAQLATFLLVSTTGE